MTTFADRLADARASYAAGLAGATDAVVASSLALGHWHRMLATPPRMTRVELMDRALRRAAFRNRNVSKKTKIDRSDADSCND